MSILDATRPSAPSEAGWKLKDPRKGKQASRQPLCPGRGAPTAGEEPVTDVVFYLEGHRKPSRALRQRVHRFICAKIQGIQD